MSYIKYIRIEGEAVSAVEETVHRRTTLPEWLAAINKLSPQVLASPVLPEGAVLYAQKGTQQLIVINQPAAVKKVIWRTTDTLRGGGPHRTRWQLAIPPHVFLLVFQHEAINSSHFYFVPRPVTDTGDMLFHCNLANVYYQETVMPAPICAGTVRLDAKASLAAKCQGFINAFWETEFNDDIQPVLVRRSDQCVFADGKPPIQLASLHAWDKATVDTPDFLTKMPWPFTPICTLSEILNERWVVS